MSFQGSMVALVTPMYADGRIDHAALADLVEWQISAGTNALVIAGTTGESATLTPVEQIDLIRFVTQQARGRIPIIAGTGTQATNTTIERTQAAKEAGADACLIVTPYYNKPPQRGLYQHYKIVAEATKLPIILYNVPTRTACDLLAETVTELAKIKNIIGIKEAASNPDRIPILIDQCDDAFSVYSGDDVTALSAMRSGAKGIISVTANVCPQQIQQFCHAALAGDWPRAEALHQTMLALHQTLFVESNPIPVKWALYDMGKIQNGLRLPLMPLAANYHDRVRQALQQAGEIVCVKS